MKKDIHPKYQEKAKFTCVCGNKFVVGSTKENVRLEICGKCHPFYTGTQQLIDTAGRVEKFKARQQKIKPKTDKKKKKTKKTSSKKI